MAPVTDLPYRLPSGVAFLWADRDLGVDELKPFCRDSNTTVIGPGLLAFVPDQHGPEVFESALLACRRLFQDLEGPVSALVFPGILERRETGLLLLSDGLVDDLRKAPPLLEPGVVHLTGHAARELETPWRLRGAPNYSGPSGRSRTVWSVHGPGDRFESWRNPKVLRRSLPALRSPSYGLLEEAVADSDLIRVQGGLGVGKTRVVAETLRSRSCLWSRCWRARRERPSIAEQVAHQLIEQQSWRSDLLDPDLQHRLFATWPEPLDEDERNQVRAAVLRCVEEVTSADAVTLVVDDAHRLEEGERSWLFELHGTGHARLVLVGRGASWLDLERSDRITVSPLDEELRQSHLRHLLEGLSIPKPVEQSFLDACRGNPFASEEGLHNLVRRRLLRENYGNFFFNGTKDARYLPTARLDRHLLSEGLRTESLTSCFRVSAAGRPIAVDLLAPEDTAVTDVADRLLQAGLVRPTRRDGIECVEPAVPAFGHGFRQCLEEHVAERLREECADAMVPRGTADQSWQRYQSLRGTSQSPKALLEALSAPRSTRPEGPALFEALSEELARGDGKLDRRTEFEFLWVFLPLARKTGRTDNLLDHLERALKLCPPADPRRMALLAMHSEESLVQGSLEHAEEKAVEGLNLARKQDPARQSVLLLQLGKVLQRQDRHPEAKRLLLDLLRTVNREANPSQVATCHFHLGNIYMQEQDFETALEHHQLALERRREHGTPTTVGQSLCSLASLNNSVGNYANSLDLYQQALDVLAKGAEPFERAFPLVGIGKTLGRLGDFEQATAPLQEALELRTQRGDKIGTEISRLALANNDLDLGRLEDAITKARHVLFRMTIIGSRRYKADAEYLLGILLFRGGKTADAFQHLQDAAHQHQQIGVEVAGLFDEAMALEACIELGNAKGIELRTQILGERLATAPYPELGERLDLRLYYGWAYQQEHGDRAGDPKVPLGRAYAEIERKAAMLEPERRESFLGRVADNNSVVELATEHGITDAKRLRKLVSQQQEPAAL